MIFKRAQFKDILYTKIPNLLLRGSEDAGRRTDGLSPESLGVLCHLLSHKENWQVTNKQIAKVFAISTGRVTSITQQLSEAGYIVRACSRSQDGSTQWDWLVFDEPQDLKNQDLENQDLKNQDLKICEQRTTIVKNNNSKEQQSTKQSLVSSPPAGVSATAWRKWIEHKSPTAVMGKKVAANIAKDFYALHKGGYDISGVVDFAIAKGWKSINTEWKALDVYKNQARKDQLLELVK